MTDAEHNVNRQDETVELTPANGAPESAMLADDEDQEEPGRIGYRRHEQTSSARP